MTNPDAQAWFHAQLHNLMDRYGIDGFKFDAGDCCFYADDDMICEPMLAREHTALFNRLGAQYPVNEFRAAGQLIVARLQDKRLLLPRYGGRRHRHLF